MVPLDVAATWTRMLSVTAGAPAAIGAPGPATRIRGKAALSWIEGPWLGILDFQGVKRCEREVLDPWLSEHAEPLLLVRHLLLSKPLVDDVFIDLTPQAREAMPEGWRDAPRPVLILAPAGRSRPERRREYLVALSQLRIPLVAGGSAVVMMARSGPTASWLKGMGLASTARIPRVTACLLKDGQRISWVRSSARTRSP